MDTSQDNCILIDRCIVYINKNSAISGRPSLLTSSDLLKIKKELEKRLNIKAEVYFK